MSPSMNHSNKTLAPGLVTLFLLTAAHAFGQCVWSTRAVLEPARNAPALAVFRGSLGDKLYLAYVGKDDQWTVNMTSSGDGLHFGGKPALLPFRSISGVALTTSSRSGCHSLFLAFASFDPDGRLVLARSPDGIDWSPPVIVDSFPKSTPVLAITADRDQGRAGAVAFTVFDLELSENPLVAVRSFDCMLTSVSDETSCFIGSEICTTLESGGTPAWASLTGKELRAVAQPGERPILHDDSQGKAVPEDQRSETGVSAAIDPATGQGYLAWESGENHRIQLFNTATGELHQCEDYTFSVPAIAFFKSSLFVAWRGGPDDRISVGSLAPF
jgi:hypothetical protein